MSIIPILVDDKESSRRIDICNKCEHLNVKGLRMFRNMCNKCGCFMPAKVKLQNSNCPEGKW